jgi:hypothetical protein
MVMIITRMQMEIIRTRITSNQKKIKKEGMQIMYAFFTFYSYYLATESGITISSGKSS